MTVLQTKNLTPESEKQKSIARFSPTSSESEDECVCVSVRQEAYVTALYGFVCVRGISPL
jgi:hypothetical protein